MCISWHDMSRKICMTTMIGSLRLLGLEEEVREGS